MDQNAFIATNYAHKCFCHGMMDNTFVNLSLQPPPTSEQACQELVLNEDEKKLLIKEGVTLPSQLPLTKV